MIGLEKVDVISTTHLITAVHCGNKEHKLETPMRVVILDEGWHQCGLGRKIFMD